MSYIDETALATWQDSEKVQTELKAVNHGLIKQAKSLDAGASWLGKNVRDKLSTIFNQTFEIPALKEEVISILSEETFDIPVNASTSDTFTATKVKMFTGYKYYPSTFKNNLITEQEYKNNKYNEMFKAMAKQKESYIQTKFEAIKTQALAVVGSTGYTFDASTDSLKITKAAQTDTLALDLQSVLGQNDLNGGYSLSSGYGLQFVLNQITKYGAANDKNLQAGLFPNIFYSNQITKEAGDNWTGWLAMDGAMAMVESHLPDFIDNVNVGTAQFGVTTRPVPFLDERIMMYQNTALADASTVGTKSTELIMSHSKEEGFFSTFFLIGNYNSDITTRVNNVIKIDGLSS